MTLIFTKHARTRLQERGFSKDQAQLVFEKADKIKPGKRTGSQEYIKKIGYQTITLIVGNNNQDKIVISAWIDPPLPGTKDASKQKRYKEYHQSSALKKIWLIIKEQFGF